MKKYTLLELAKREQDKSERELKQYETMVSDLYYALDTVETKSKKHERLVNRVKNLLEENEDSIMDIFVS